jgi:hypothetical protein
MTTMISKINKTILLFAAGILSTTVSAQQGTGGREYGQYSHQQQREYRQEQRDTTRTKTSYLTVSGGVGSSSFRYDLDYRIEGFQEKGNRDSKLGYEVDIRYSYFFNPHWGVTTGVGISRYATVGRLRGDMSDDKYMKLGTMTDDDDFSGHPRDFELRVRLKSLEEKQTAFLLDIPLMAMYQTHFGEEENWGLYAGLGVKLQIPVQSKYKVQGNAASELNISGYYPHIPSDVGSPSESPVPHHGFGTISDPGKELDWSDKNKLKLGVVGTAEMGFMVALGEDTDLLLGGYIDYGFTNMKKKKDQGLLSTPASYHPEGNKIVGQGIPYNGILNSNVTDKVKVMSFGVKLGLRFKLN